MVESVRDAFALFSDDDVLRLIVGNTNANAIKTLGSYWKHTDKVKILSDIYRVIIRCRIAKVCCFEPAGQKRGLLTYLDTFVLMTRTQDQCEVHRGSSKLHPLLN